MLISIRKRRMSMGSLLVTRATRRRLLRNHSDGRLIVGATMLPRTSSTGWPANLRQPCRPRAADGVPRKFGATSVTMTTMAPLTTLSSRTPLSDDSRARTPWSRFELGVPTAKVLRFSVIDRSCWLLSMTKKSRLP